MEKTLTHDSQMERKEKYTQTWEILIVMGAETMEYGFLKVVFIHDNHQTDHKKRIHTDMGHFNSYRCRNCGKRFSQGSLHT